jgi:hypothetical protein
MQAGGRIRSLCSCKRSKKRDWLCKVPVDILQLMALVST